MLRDSKPVTLESCTCTRVAGTALWNHVAALLYQTAHYSQLELKAVPLVHSCTETAEVAQAKNHGVTNRAARPWNREGRHNGNSPFKHTLTLSLMDVSLPFTKTCLVSLQGVKPGLVNKMVILSARPKERRLLEGIRFVLLLHYCIVTALLYCYCIIVLLLHYCIVTVLLYCYCVIVLLLRYCIVTALLYCYCVIVLLLRYCIVTALLKCLQT